MLICDVTTNFKLADDLMIVTKSKSIAGGIYSDTKDVIKRVPRDMTNEDVKALMDLFFVVTFKTIAENFNITLTIPGV
jgi:hypothetical protein